MKAEADCTTVLDAPNLRDDFYCSVLAYSSTCHTLAVGLGELLYAWSELAGVHLLHAGNRNSSWLTSLAFSSTQGTKAVLAFGRSDGTLNLMSLYDGELSYIIVLVTLREYLARSITVPPYSLWPALTCNRYTTTL
jgi:hypothetical protein